MYSVVLLDLLSSKKLENLRKRAKEEIKLRGYTDHLNSDLSNESNFLPINEITGDYCPTWRYSWIKKFVKNPKKQITWPILQGRIIDNVYEKIIEYSSDSINNVKLEEMDLKKQLERNKQKIMEGVKKEIKKELRKINNAPKEEEIKNFIGNINKIIEFEHSICLALLSFKMSTKKDLRIRSEIKILFPISIKQKINGKDLGFSGSSEPDFLYREDVVGEIKSGGWRESFKLTCAAYALAYESEYNRDIDLMVIINPSFSKKRKTPLQENFTFEIISDVYRKAVFTRRDERIELIKKGNDPGTPKKDEKCIDCQYYPFCWGRKNGKK
ncbi:CRISPR-associated protein Cas4 [Candidatus Pacearchaeota archaeon]|nr:CRISPR-associated protein Cas4 [Candidatus Pacearchaeota archaeon]